MIWYDCKQNDELTWNKTSASDERYDKRYVKWYVWNASGVVLNDNENKKTLGSHALLCTNALGDTHYHSR